MSAVPFRSANGPVTVAPKMVHPRGNAPTATVTSLPLQLPTAPTLSAPLLFTTSDEPVDAGAPGLGVRVGLGLGDGDAVGEGDGDAGEGDGDGVGFEAGLAGLGVRGTGVVRAIIGDGSGSGACEPASESSDRA